MGKVLLICRLAVKDIRHRPAQAVLLLLAIATGAATLTLGLALRGTTDNPYARTRAAANGPDVVATVFPGGSNAPGSATSVGPGGSGGPSGPGSADAGGPGGPRARLGRGRAQRAVPRDVGAAPDGAYDGRCRGGRAEHCALVRRPAKAVAGRLDPARRGGGRGSALRGVDGVTSAEEQDRETWFVTGTPSGKALTQAAAQVVDGLADRARAHMSL